MTTFAHRKISAVLLAVGMFTALSAQAGIFDDDEARRAILDMRSRIDALNTRMDTKADKNSALSLSDQNDQVRQELANLRGQVEVLQNSVDQLEQRQKDFYADLDNRLRKVEPKQVQVDGQSVSVAPDEQKTYDDAFAVFKSGDYNGARSAMQDFINRYPQSGYVSAAQYWLGSSLYALKDNKNALTTLQQIPVRFPDSAKAPDALLLLAAIYGQQKDSLASKRAMDTLMAKYPNSPAAATARQSAGR